MHVCTFMYARTYVYVYVCMYVRVCVLACAPKLGLPHSRCCSTHWRNSGSGDSYVSATTGTQCFGPLAQYVVHALKGLACRARVTLAHAEVTKNIIFSSMGPKHRYPHGTTGTQCFLHTALTKSVREKDWRQRQARHLKAPPRASHSSEIALVGSRCQAFHACGSASPFRTSCCHSIAGYLSLHPMAQCVFMR
jgi:hypothetical protein